jgi:hypothetical protein
MLVNLLLIFLTVQSEQNYLFVNLVFSQKWIVLKIKAYEVVADKLKLNVLAYLKHFNFKSVDKYFGDQIFYNFTMFESADSLPQRLIVIIEELNFLVPVALACVSN